MDQVIEAIQYSTSRIRALELRHAVPWSYQQQLINGGFEAWRLGAGPFTADAAETADNWLIDLVGAGTMTVTRESVIVDINSRYCMKVENVHGAGIAYNYIGQSFSVQHALMLAGNQVAMSIRARTAVASGVRLRLEPLATTPADLVSDWHSGNDTWETLVVANPVATTSLMAMIEFGASGTYYVDSAILVVGAAPVQYAPSSNTDYLLAAIETAGTVGDLATAVADYLRARQ